MMNSLWTFSLGAKISWSSRPGLAMKHSRSSGNRARVEWIALDLAILTDEVGGQVREPVGIDNDGRHEVNDGRREGGIAGGKPLLAFGTGRRALEDSRNAFQGCCKE